MKTQHHGIKLKEWSLRLKIATVDDKTMLLGREFQTFMTRE